MKYSKEQQLGELGGQISLSQCSFRFTFSQFWVILALWVRGAFSTAVQDWYSTNMFL